MENLTKLYIISFLDSLNLGLIMPVLNPHLLGIGGSHTTTGLLVSLHCLAQIIATILIKGLYQKYNKKQALIYTLTAALISNITLAISSSFWVVFTARLVFYLTNQTQTVLHAYVRTLEHPTKHDIIHGVFGALGVGGFLAGPIISGYMFAWKNGFSSVSILASAINLLSIWLVLLLPNLQNEVASVPSVTSYMIKDMKVSLHLAKTKLAKANVKCYGPLYLLKVFVTISLTAFFMKFSMLLKMHFDASSVVIGYTVAYQSMIMFLMNFVMIRIKSFLSTDSKTQLIQILSTSLIAMAGICFAITHDMYMILFIPLALSRLLLDWMWASLVFLGRGLETTEASAVFATITAFVTPFLLGIYCDMYGYQAVKMFSIVPLLFAILLALWRFEPAPVQAQTASQSGSKTISDNKSLVDSEFSDESHSFEMQKGVELKKE